VLHVRIYCPVDALYVDPDCEQPHGITPAEALGTGSVGQYRRDSGWGEWRKHPHYRNASGMMDRIFAHARRVQSPNA
jgi:hypothetical protein